MALSLYDTSVPVYIRSLTALSKVLKKSEQWATENGVPHERLVMLSRPSESFL